MFDIILMVKDNITPEERLLKIIENPGPQRRRTIVRPGQVSAASFKSWLKYLRINKDILKQIDLKTVNKIVAAVCVVVTIFWIVDFFMVGASLKKRLEQIRTGTVSLAPEAPKIEDSQVNLGDVIVQSRRRNIFTLLPPQPPVSKGAEATLAAGTMKLVGIIWSDNPQAMIEDSREQKTFLVGAGENIGEFRIKTILRNKVILLKGDEELELR